MARPPQRMFGPPLTGQARFREDWRGRLVLQLEVIVRHDRALGGDSTRWQDAEESDLTWLRQERELNGLDPLI